MPSFKGNRKIILQPSDRDLVFYFDHTTNSSVSAGDGFLPYGKTISSVEATAYTEDGTNCTSALIEASSVTDDVVSLRLNYPTAFGDGRYFIKMVNTLNDGSIIESDFKRVFCENL